MNKKHFIGMLIVLLISGFVIWQELRKRQLKHYGELARN